MLSIAKHLKYSMNNTGFRYGSQKTHGIYYKCSIYIKFHQYVTKAVFRTTV